MMRLEAVLHNMLFVIAGYCSDMIRLTKQRICKAQGYDLAQCGERSLTETGCTTNTACTSSGFSPVCARKGVQLSVVRKKLNVVADGGRGKLSVVTDGATGKRSAVPNFYPYRTRISSHNLP